MSEEKKSRYTEAQAKAAKKYLSETVEDVRIRVPKGQKAIIKTHADNQGESMNQFVVRAINETMERDNGSNITPPVSSRSKPQQIDSIQVAGNRLPSGWVLSPKTGKALLVPENINKVDFEQISNVTYQCELVDVFGSDGFSELYKMAADEAAKSDGNK